MLLSLRVANHGSVRAPQELNLAPSYEGDHPAVPVVAIYGANASGKSTVIDAFRFFVQAVRESQARWLPDGPVPRRPFKLDHTSRNETSSYGMDLLLDGVRHVYGFSVTDAAVVEEWLYTYPKNRKRVLFERTGMQMTYGATLTGQRTAAERIMRPNSLYLSAAAQTSHEQLGSLWRHISGSTVIEDSRREAQSRGSAARTASHEMGDRLDAPMVNAVLQAADLGVHGVRRGAGSGPGDGFTSRAVGEQVGEVTERELEFVHRVGDDEFVLSAEEESAGTAAWLYLATMTREALHCGGTLWVDELDQSLHPLLTGRLLSAFQSPGLNPRGAQLIFSTHDAALLGTMLGDEVLRRDQVWFVEKDMATGASELYPLSDFRPRKGENFERRYLAGSYGAVPLLPAAGFEGFLTAGR